MIDIPFYPNHEDAMRCMLAVYRMVLKHFTGKEWSWDELVELTGYQPKKAAWTVGALVKLAAMGFDIRMIEKFDYKRYGETGEMYLHEYFSSEKYDWMVKNSNILEIQPQIPAFLPTVKYEKRSPQLADLDAMLAEERLVFVTLNSRVLNDAIGFTDHALLVLAKEGDDYVVHDPGPSPQPNRRVPGAKLLEAMGGGYNTSEMTGFKLAA